MDEGLVENSENKKRFLDSTHLTRNTKKLLAPFLEIRKLQHNTSSKVQSPHLSAEKSVKKPLAPMSRAVVRVIEQLESRLDVSAIFCPSSQHSIFGSKRKSRFGKKMPQIVMSQFFLFKFATQPDLWDRICCCKRRMKPRRCCFGSGALCWCPTSGAVGSLAVTLGDEPPSS